MERRIVLKSDIKAALENLGIPSGQVLMVHTSLSALGFVCGGAQVVIEALLDQRQSVDFALQWIQRERRPI